MFFFTKLKAKSNDHQKIGSNEKTNYDPIKSYYGVSYSSHLSSLNNLCLFSQTEQNFRTCLRKIIEKTLINLIVPKNTQMKHRSDKKKRLSLGENFQENPKL